jgi:arylformamidase
MKKYDITLPLSQNLPVWPGDKPYNRYRISEIDKGDNSNTSFIEMCAHMGTHVDAPDHFLGNQDTVENLAINILCGRVYVLELKDTELITAEDLMRAEIPPRTRRILFKTRNSTYWQSNEQVFQPDFVGLSPDGAQFIVDRGVKLVGIDYLSIAPFKKTRPTHEILLGAGIVILEGLNLSAVSPGRYSLYCLPLKLVDSDGAPARAILMGV